MDHRSDHPSRHQPRRPSRPGFRQPSRHPVLPVVPALVIECDDCIMQHTSACEDCLVTFVLAADDDPCQTPLRDASPDVAAGAPSSARPEPLVLDRDEAIAVDRLTRAGLVPVLRHEAAVP